MKVSAKKLRTIMGIGLLAALLLPAASRPQAPKNDFIVYGGDVVTLDKAGTVAQAVWVRDGKIDAVGPRDEVMR
ncbi:MAG: amidohydrolase, partial [bacterium]